MLFNLHRAKVYFFVIAAFMCLSLFAFTYRYTTTYELLRTIGRGSAKVFRGHPTDQNVSDSTLSQGFKQFPIHDIRGQLVDQINVTNIDEAVRIFMKSGSSTVASGRNTTNVSDIDKQTTAGTILPKGNGTHDAATVMSSLGTHVVPRNEEIDRPKPKVDKQSKDSKGSGSNKVSKVDTHFTVISRNDLMRLDALNNRRRQGLNQRIKDRLIHIGKIVDMHDPRLGGATTRPDECSGCFKSDFKPLIEAPEVCPSSEPVDLLILITSVASNVEARTSVRNTWGAVCNQPGTSIKCVFIFGNKNVSGDNKILLGESKTYHDIYQADFVDTYANLTFKTMTGFRWMQDHCNHAKFVMKTDDDVYLNTELLPILLRATPEIQFMGGMCWGPSPPHRDTHSKWYVSFEQYVHPLFPPMCSGTGYILSRDVVVGAVQISSDIPFFYLEDVYMAICAKRMDVHPVFVTGFSNVPVEFEPCKFRNKIFLSHSHSPPDLLDRWRRSRMCKLEEHTPEMLYKVRRV